MKAGLFFGTFNPIHIGHLIIANHLVEYSDLDEVWFIITPMSPFKQKKSLLENNHRKALAEIAVENFPNLKVSDIEFQLPQPNYTINTLVRLKEKYPEKDFSLIMGEDNLISFHKWKNYETILDYYNIYVYPRANEIKEKPALHTHPKVHYVKAPIIELSSTFIRKAIQEKKDVRSMLPPEVWRYIDEMNFYS